MKGTSEIKVGAVTIGGLIIFLAIITFLGMFNFISKGYNIDVMFQNVGGLQEGAFVRYAGVKFGSVEKVQVEGNKVRVRLRIKEGMEIPVGSKFSLSSSGMMGEKYVEIAPANQMDGKYIAAGAEIEGKSGQGIDEMLIASSQALDKVNDLLDSFNNVLGDKKVQESVRVGLMNTRDISDNLNNFSRVMAEMAVANQEEINTMVSQMSQMSTRMNAVASHLESVAANADNDGKMGRDIAAIADNLAKASGRVDNITKVLEGVAEEPQTKQDLRDTVHNAKEVSMKANRMLDTVRSAKFQTEVMYNDKKGDWRTNMGVTLRPAADSFFYAGATDVGESTKLDLEFGKDLAAASVRMGVMQGSFGVGLDYRLGNNFKLFSDFYDFNDAKLKVGGELMFNKNLSLIGQSYDVLGNGSEQAYVGLRGYF